LQVKYDAAVHNQVKIILYNMAGVTCKQKSLTSNESSLYLGELSNGLYMVKLTDTNGCFKIQKILKQ